jgi:Zn/Cd-binding protein ZinT
MKSKTKAKTKVVLKIIGSNLQITKHKTQNTNPFSIKHKTQKVRTIKSKQSKLKILTKLKTAKYSELKYSQAKYSEHKMKPKYSKQYHIYIIESHKHKTPNTNPLFDKTQNRSIDDKQI